MSSPTTPTRGKTTPASSGGSFKSDEKTDPDSTLPTVPAAPRSAKDIRSDALELHHKTLRTIRLAAAKSLAETILKDVPDAIYVTLSESNLDDGYRPVALFGKDHATIGVFESGALWLKNDTDPDGDAVESYDEDDENMFEDFPREFQLADLQNEETGKWEPDRAFSFIQFDEDGEHPTFYLKPASRLVLE